MNTKRQVRKSKPKRPKGKTRKNLTKKRVRGG